MWAAMCVVMWGGQSFAFTLIPENRAGGHTAPYTVHTQCSRTGKISRTQREVTPMAVPVRRASLDAVSKHVSCNRRKQPVQCHAIPSSSWNERSLANTVAPVAAAAADLHAALAAAVTAVWHQEPPVEGAGAV
jgi:hypothetical protein